MAVIPATVPHRRRNPLTGGWVLVSPHRLSRPWQGRSEEALPAVPSYDPDCYLCPGNERASGEVNPPYDGVFVFENDFAALKQGSGGEEGEREETCGDPLFQVESAPGTCRVVCFSPDHARTLPLLRQEEVRAVVDAWCQQAEELGRTWRWVQIFENKGAMMGASNPHPHGQIWATRHLPEEATVEERTQRAYLEAHGTPMLLDLAAREAEAGERVVVQSDDWLAVVPYWASWPFETLLLPRFPVTRLPELRDAQRSSLAHALKELTTRYDNLFRTSFPYSMGWHGAPFGGDGKQEESRGEHWQLHAHFYPPLLRSASVRKFMVGYEMLAEPQRDLTPERAAKMLRDAGADHYLSAGRP